MSKRPMRKAAASSRDLFAKLEDELKRKPIKAAKPAATAKPPPRSRGSLYRRRYRGAGRTRAGAPAPGHVYRRHRREGDASPLRRGARQRHGRGGGRPCRSISSVALEDDGFVTVTDNGRGIPVDPHPKFRNKSALEVIMTTLHSGGKFDSKVYATSGGLHGVGVSVANALSETMEVEVARGQKLYRQSLYARRAGRPAENLGRSRTGAARKIRFRPDPKIFGKGCAFKPARLFRMARSKAYLFRGVEISWSCAKALLAGDSDTPEKRRLPLPRRLEGLSRRPHRWPGGRHQGRVRRPHRADRRLTARSNGRSPGSRATTAS